MLPSPAFSRFSRRWMMAWPLPVSNKARAPNASFLLFSVTLHPRSFFYNNAAKKNGRENGAGASGAVWFSCGAIYCPGLPWMSKVPRRGTTSLAVGETHGLQQNCLSTPKGSNPFYTDQSPNQIQPLRGWQIVGAHRFRGFHPRLMTLDLFEVPLEGR